ncbi:MAG: hypothetical protein CVU43_15295 [Chloroflexi bacterium HGW-Chloroflexi-5]|nr:MAG: hypothetical protein CVU43_15295 [Chloroflexi bacterium HGW-Chloroflexi-5]
MAHKVYGAIVSAVRSGRLSEPFDRAAFRRACPGLGSGTYNAFLDKHAVGNPGGASELFERVAPGRFVCVRPFKYGL